LFRITADFIVSEMVVALATTTGRSRKIDVKLQFPPSPPPLSSLSLHYSAISKWLFQIRAYRYLLPLHPNLLQLHVF
jgi:hypothetical protein